MKSFNPSIDENYFARSEIDTEDILPVSTADFIVAYYVAGFVIIILITAILLWTYRVTHHWDKKLMRLSKRSRANKYAQSKIFSVAVTTGVLIVCVLVLDCLGIKTLRENKPVLQTRNIDDRLLPYMVLVFDVILSAVWLLCWICSCGKWIQNYRNFDYANDESAEYLLLALSILPTVISFTVHLPYITIAYLNDASHATSMFIYYILVVFAFFSAIDLTYSTYIDALIIAREKQPQDTGTGNEHGLRRIFGFYNQERRIQNLSAFGTPAFAILIVFLVGMTTAALVTVPISKAFTDTSNRLLGFYQTAFVFIGAYVVYKSLFEKKPIEIAIENRRTPVRNGDAEQWKNLTKDEKIAELYSCVMDILAKCERQAGTRSRGVATDSNEQGSQDRRRSQEEAKGHVPGTDQGRCSGLCCHTILSMLQSANSQSDSAPAVINENTPLNASES